MLASSTKRLLPKCNIAAGRVGQLLRRLATAPKSRLRVCIASRVAGLREAMDAHDGFQGRSFTWIEDSLDTSIARQLLQECEVLVGEPSKCGPIVDHCKELLWLQSTWAGCNPLLTTSSRRDYVVTRLAGCFGPDMAEYCALHILALERKYEHQRECQRNREWQAVRDAGGLAQGGANYRRLSSLTLGVLGLGDIGTDIARMAAQGLRMRVVGCRRDASEREGDKFGGVSFVYGLDALDAFLAECDYVVSVLPSTPATIGMLDANVLAVCSSRKPVFINVGRGDLISEKDIIESLDSGLLSHYVGDVFHEEPLPRSSNLWHHPKVTVTPHNSAVTKPEDIVNSFADNLERFEAGGVKALRNVFKWDRGY